METRARYVLVGAFTLFGLLAALGFILWLAKVQIDRTYAQYDILFDTVAGLGTSSAVRYNGVDVGTVLAIALDRENAALVRVRIEIYASTPVRADTMATLASQGVTGVSFVALEAGSSDAPRLERIPPAPVAVIQSKPSVVQELMVGAPELLNDANLLIQDIRGFTTRENRAAIAGILENVENATARIDGLANRAESFLSAAEKTLAKADLTLAEMETTFVSANTAFVSADKTIKAAHTTIVGINKVVEKDVPVIVAKVGDAVDSVRTATAGLKDFAQTGLPQYSTLAQDARNLVSSLTTLADRISSDPGRFLLGSRTPAYRN